MKPENAIEVHNITKQFRIYMDKGHTLKERTLFSNRRKYEERNVLNGISFEVKKGEAIGLIGHNGCGKSTTLKLLTKIMYPDSGSIEMNGRVSSLIELGAGFHPDMSGRENIYINASIFGLTKKEIQKREKEIIEFSELEEFIDNPVRTYSSGMYMRLAFAVAINVDADILLVDEILAVGDMSFQAKCFNKLRELKKNGMTIVIVSHSLGQVEEICERSIWIDQGVIKLEGKPAKVHREYTMFMSEYTMGKDSTETEVETETETETETQEAEGDEIEEIDMSNPVMVKKTLDKNTSIDITNITMKDSNGREKKNFITGEQAIVEFDYVSYEDESQPASLELLFVRNDGLECYETNTFREGYALFEVKNKGKIRCTIDKLNLIAGDYYLELSFRKQNGFPYVYKDEAYKISITTLDRERGIAKLDHTWDFGLLGDKKHD